MKTEQKTPEEKKEITQVDVAAEDLRVALRKVTASLDEHEGMQQRLGFLHAVGKKSEELHVENELLKKQLEDLNTNLKDQVKKK